MNQQIDPNVLRLVAVRDAGRRHRDGNGFVRKLRPVLLTLLMFLPAMPVLLGSATAALASGNGPCNTDADCINSNVCTTDVCAVSYTHLTLPTNREV